MRAVVLTYHSINIEGNDYHNNDHVALAEDLKLLQSMKCNVLSLSDCVRLFNAGRREQDDRYVAITFDDGSWFDWFDLIHPAMGLQRSFRSILLQAPMRVSATSFVIASPEARVVLDDACLIGKGWWSDEWWPEAARGDLLSIGNHSWDHNHPALSATAISSGPKGQFSQLSTFDEAEAEIATAQRYLGRLCAPASCSFFAYPYGDCSDYLVREYFPLRGNDLGLKAAFTTCPEPVARGANRWCLGRYVCGHHWKSPSELRGILSDAFRQY